LRQRLAISGALVALAAAGWLHLRQQKQNQQRSKHLRQLRELGLGSAGFELRDTSGRPRGKRDLLGSWVLLYFGFTHCPDVCPEELEKLGEAVRLLEERSELPPVLPVFITVDPERDDEEAMRKYLREFHPRLVGLTGSAERVREAAAAFRVYVSAGPRDELGDYVVDHSVLTFLLDPDGICRECYGRASTAQEVARSVRGHMESYEPLGE
ncbi:SCO2 protein, partial [Vireo altiloquus]|nr:SCO2 protein [Vireo altiloquus]